MIYEKTMTNEDKWMANYEAIKAGRNIKLQKGDSSVEITSEKTE